MKTSNLQSTATHPAAIIRGWVDGSAAGTDAGTVVSSGLENASGGALAEGDVVVLDSDGTINTTTTQDDPRPKGIVLDDIDAGEFGPVAFAGPVPLVNVGASVTAGDYFRTSTVAGEADDVATPTSGTFGYFTSSGTTPSGFLTGSGSAVSPSGGGSLPWFVVTDAAYGAVGDGTTDDTTAINAAIADLIAADGGVLYFPATTDSYLVTGALTAISVPCRILGDGKGSTLDVDDAATRITVTGNAVTFDLTFPGITFEGISGIHTGTAATAGCFIRINVGPVAVNGGLVRLVNWSAKSFYDNIDLASEANFQISDFANRAAVRYNFRLRNTTNQDAGDGSIHTGLVTTASDAVAFYYEGGGGLRMHDIKYNGGGTGYCFQSRQAGNTSILMIEHCSFENFKGNGIDIDSNGATSAFLVLQGLQFGLYGNTTGYAINIAADSPGDIEQVVIDNIVATGASAGTNPAVVNLVNLDGVHVGAIEHQNFVARLTTTGCTNLIDGTGGVAGGAQVPSAPAGELGGTWASPTVDAVHSGSAHLALGSTSSTAAAGDHTHSGSAGVGAILLASDAGVPFAFDDILQASDGSDFLYASE